MHLAEKILLLQPLNFGGDYQPLARAYSFCAGGGPEKWQWATWTYPASNGLADTFEDALANIKAAVRALPEAARVKHP